VVRAAGFALTRRPNTNPDLSLTLTGCVDDGMQFGRDEVVELLLAAGSDTEMVDGAGISALQVRRLIL